ncbi:NAD-dependent epimerase/dehydratase family protein [Iodobacter arcticus]|uniref:NAD-dependent epimerase/dehydratase family protein n=1 Tax=Iodobacter arcticus TaxID=590593 RepID=A0ABW2QWF7_9NEIS
MSLNSPLIKEDFERLSPFFLSLDEIKNKKILLTGGTGFFGRWLLALLHYLNLNGFNISVTVVSRSPEKFLISEPSYRDVRWLDFIESDAQCFEVSRKYDCIIHAATDTSLAVQADGLSLFNSMINGGRNILDIAVKSGAKKVLMIGSGAQYGAQPEEQPLFLEDSTSACLSNSPLSAYGEAKRSIETMAALYASKHSFDVIFARCFAFSGPGLAIDTHFAIGNFVRDALFSQNIVVKSKGEIYRSYLYGADLAIWLLTLLLKGKNQEAYNVGSDQAILISDLAECVKNILAPEKEVIFLSNEGGGSRSRYIPSINKARSHNLDVWTNLDESIQRTADWNKSYFLQRSK